jgi:ATP-dependent DNA helicase RecQ
MGINKGNIHYTIHYGLPSSMESLYQEAGRAARDKQKFDSQQAKCLVLLTKESPDKKRALETLWDPQSNLSDIQQVSKGLKGDLNTNLFMLTSNLDTINDEYLLIKKTYALYCTGKKELVTVYGKDIGIDKAKVEKVIYRLYQLGIVKDWTIENFFNKGIFSIEVNTQHNNDSIIKSIYKVIHKYETDFSLDGLADDPSTRYHIILKKNASKFNEFEKHILVLLIWSYEHFVYNRKQSLKNVYEICTELISSIKTKEQFKESLESYFRFNESSYVLQYIAENPTDIKKWFCLFYDDKDNSFILHRQQLHFKDQLSRFLESYMQNPGLDMISGLIRILLDDYENTDGRKRMEASLAKVRNYEEELQNEILENILRIGKEMDDPQRKTLSKALLVNFDTSLAGTLYEELNDDYSLAVILDSYSHKIKNICGDMENKWRI